MVVTDRPGRLAFQPLISHRWETRGLTLSGFSMRGLLFQISITGTNKRGGSWTEDLYPEWWTGLEMRTPEEQLRLSGVETKLEGQGWDGLDRGGTENRLDKVSCDTCPCGLFVTCIVQNSALRPTNSTCTVTHSHTSYFHIFNAADCLWHFTATMCTTAAVVDCNLSMYDSQAALFIYLFYSYLALVHYYT